jgi:D-alanyl-lipoteichoic acid acyltransferase DltB (MBOAT superfamily)
MDITIDGFHSWMWRGLSFLLPFLIIGYCWQLYNAYVLYTLYYHPEATWQVIVALLVSGDYIRFAWIVADDLSL